MPGFITHLSFGEQSLSFIDSKNTKYVIDAHLASFNLGLQGPDIFFYHIPAYLFYKKNIGNIMHQRDVMLFFDSLLDSRNSFGDNHDRHICDAYIMGFIGHYTLDVSCHPYIYYKSDHFNNLKRSGLYDFGKHVSLETDIDHIVLEHYKKLKPSEFDYAKAVKPSQHAQAVITELLFNALNKTYTNNFTRKGTIKHAITSFVKLNHLMKDPTGKKKYRVRKIEQLLFKHCVISAMIPSDTKIKFSDPCNTFHNTWHNPWNPSIPRSESIFDLINKSMPSFINRINLYMLAVSDNSFSDTNLDTVTETNTYLHYRNLLLEDLSDLSYLSGLPL